MKLKDILLATQTFMLALNNIASADAATKTDTTAADYNTIVTGLNNGGFVVTWHDPLDTFKIHEQIYNKDGVEITTFDAPATWGFSDQLLTKFVQTTSCGSTSQQKLSSSMFFTEPKNKKLESEMTQKDSITECPNEALESCYYRF